MRRLQRGGLPAVDALAAALNRSGRRLELTHSSKGYRSWTELSGKKRLLLSVSRVEDIRTALVSFQAERQVRLTPRQARIDRLQKAFYSRCMEIGQAFYKGERKRLGREESLVLLIGELEADVNNGGFSQYLGNKGRPRAKAALAALRAVGARRTAALLKAALAPGIPEESLSTLDDRFRLSTEDLAALTVTRLRKWFGPIAAAGAPRDRHKTLTRPS